MESAVGITENGPREQRRGRAESHQEPGRSVHTTVRGQPPLLLGSLCPRPPLHPSLRAHSVLVNMGAAFQHEPESQHELSRASCHTQGPPQSPWVLARLMALFFPQRSCHRAPLCQNEPPAFTPCSPPPLSAPQPCGPPSLSMLPSITFLKSNHRVKKNPRCGLQAFTGCTFWQTLELPLLFSTF